MIQGVDVKNYKQQYDSSKVRELIKDLTITNEYDHLGRIFFDYEFRSNDSTKQYPRSPIWNKQLEIHSRIPAGAIKRATANMNSYISNEKFRIAQQLKKKEKEDKQKKKKVEKTEEERKNEYRKKQEKLNKKKNDKQNLYFDDNNYPSALKNMIGYYSFGNKKYN